jgi:hypothetical protein
MKGDVRHGYTVIDLTSSLARVVPWFDGVDSSVPARPLGRPGPRRECLPPRFALLLLLLAMLLAFPVFPPPRPLPPLGLLLLPLEDDLPPPPFRRGTPVDISKYCNTSPDCYNQGNF